MSVNIASWKHSPIKTIPPELRKVAVSGKPPKPKAPKVVAKSNLAPMNNDEVKKFLNDATHMFDDDEDHTVADKKSPLRYEEGTKSRVPQGSPGLRGNNKSPAKIMQKAELSQSHVDNSALALEMLTMFSSPENSFSVDDSSNTRINLVSAPGTPRRATTFSESKSPPLINQREATTTAYKMDAKSPLRLRRPASAAAAPAPTSVQQQQAQPPGQSHWQDTGMEHGQTYYEQTSIAEAQQHKRQQEKQHHEYEQSSVLSAALQQLQQLQQLEQRQEQLYTAGQPFKPASQQSERHQSSWRGEEDAGRRATGKSTGNTKEGEEEEFRVVDYKVREEEEEEEEEDLAEEVRRNPEYMEHIRGLALFELEFEAPTTLAEVGGANRNSSSSSSYSIGSNNNSFHQAASYHGTYTNTTDTTGGGTGADTGAGTGAGAGIAGGGGIVVDSERQKHMEGKGYDRETQLAQREAMLIKKLQAFARLPLDMLHSLVLKQHEEIVGMKLFEVPST
jgi:hypothetical protein